MPELARKVSESRLSRLLDNIKTDPDLQPVERQVAFVSDGDSDVFHFDVEEPTLMRHAILHPEAKVHEIRVTDADRFGARMSPEEYREGAVTGVKGEIPVGCVKVSASSRSTPAWSRVFASSVLENDPRRDGGDR